VIYWNATNDWASFRFQGGDRFYEDPKFSLHLMFTNMLVIVTPLPLLALPYLFFKTRVGTDADVEEPLDKRSGRFVNSFLFVPMLVFAWNALENEPRYNWTGPLWIAMLPVLGWIVVHAQELKWRYLAILIQKLVFPITLVVLCIYALTLHYMTMGVPGASFPKNMAKMSGWPQVVRSIDEVASSLPGYAQGRRDNDIVVVGLNKYYIASKLAYHGTPTYLGDEKWLRVSGQHLLNEHSLMFKYWDPADNFTGKTLILFSNRESDLDDDDLSPYFERLSEKAVALPMIKNDFGLKVKPMRDYYYRIGYGYLPPSDQ